MRAVVFHSHGDPGVLQLTEQEDPHPGPGEVLVRVRACALNHLDLWVRTGWRGLRLEMPHILGSDVAGVVEGLGDGVGRVAVGQEVLLGPGLGCGTCGWCLRGEDNRCPRYRILGENARGGYAELVAVPERNVFPKPPNLSFEEAACLPLVYTTAWGMLVERARILPGERVLIHAAGSGVGSAAIQVAKLFGAEVIATASTAEKLEKARELGADHLVNYAEEDFADRVREITGKAGVAVVFEHTGASTFDGSLRSLAVGGRLITCGATAGPTVEIDIRRLFAKHLTIIGNTMGSLSAMIPIVQQASSGRLRPVLDRVLPLSAAAEAHRILEKREQFGKVVLKP